MSPDSTHDALTGLWRPKPFAEALSELERVGTAYSLIVADVDDLRSTNHWLGHGVGDDVLRGVARVLRGSAPPEAMVGRVAGNAFAVVLAGAHWPLVRALAWANVVRADVATQWSRDQWPEVLRRTVTVAGAHSNEGPCRRLADERLEARKQKRRVRGGGRVGAVARLAQCWLWVTLRQNDVATRVPGPRLLPSRDAWLTEPAQHPRPRSFVEPSAVSLATPNDPSQFGRETGSAQPHLASGRTAAVVDEALALIDALHEGAAFTTDAQARARSLLTRVGAALTELDSSEAS